MAFRADLGGMRDGCLRPYMALWHGKGMANKVQHALAQRAGGLFTLRESRRGRLEAGGSETRCSVDVKSSKTGARSPPKSFPEAPGGIKHHCQEHREQQVGPPGSSRALILTLGGPIWAFLDLNWEPRRVNLVPRGAVLGAPGLHIEGPGAPHGSILSI